MYLFLSVCFFRGSVGAAAEAAQRLVEANHMESIIKVVKGKVEEIELPEKVDVIVSEPIGFLLVRQPRRFSDFLPCLGFPFYY